MVDVNNLFRIYLAIFALLTLIGTTGGCGGPISCCSEGFTPGDNNGDGGEAFIQPYQYVTNCEESCKKKYPTETTGITESLLETYSTGEGKNKNKCWCEFGAPKLDSSNSAYQTCIEDITGLHNWLRTAFTQLDTDQDGKIQCDQLKDVLKTVKLNLDGTVAFLADVDNDFMLTVDEIINYLISEEHGEEPSRDQYVSAAFELHDTDRNGKLTVEEWTAMYLDGMMNMDYADAILIFDKDGDGEISLEEMGLQHT